MRSTEDQLASAYTARLHFQGVIAEHQTQIKRSQEMIACFQTRIDELEERIEGLQIKHRAEIVAKVAKKIEAGEDAHKAVTESAYDTDTQTQQKQ